MICLLVPLQLALACNLAGYPHEGTYDYMYVITYDYTNVITYVQSGWLQSVGPQCHSSSSSKPLGAGNTFGQSRLLVQLMPKGVVFSFLFCYNTCI